MSAAASSASRARTLRRGAAIAAGLGVWVLMVDLPYRADVGFDMSWRLVLHWAATRPLAFGRELVFSYGPLGDLVTRAYAGSWPWDYLAAQAALAAIGAALGAAAASRLGPVRGLLLAIFLVLFAWGETLVTLVLLLVAGLFLAAEKVPGAAVPAAAALCGALAAARPTAMSLGAVVVAAIVAACLRAGRGRLAAWAVVVAPASLVLAWVLAGQSPGDLPLFLERSVLYARGNLESMALEESARTFALGVSALLLVLGAAASPAFATRGLGWRPAVASLVVWGFAFVKWKHGFVRADTHVNHFFLFVVALAIVHPLFDRAAASGRRARSAALALAAVLSVAGSLGATPGGAAGWTGSIAGRLRQKASAIASPRALGARYEAHWRELRAATALPRTADVVGEAPLDVVGPAQGLVFTNGLRYHPRPVFQSWAAYSGPLNRINEAFFLSPERPAFVLQQLQTIDRRLPSQDDARVLPLLLRDYSVVHVEGGHLLWTRRQGTPRAAPRTRLAVERDVAFGEVVPLGELAGQDLWLEADYGPSWPGRLRRLLYKLPSAWIHVARPDGGEQAFRLLRLVAADGMLLSPLFRDAGDWERYATGGPRLDPASLRITLPEGAERWFGPRIRVRLSTIELGAP